MPEPVVLVVEDDPQMQRLLRTQLAVRGFEVHVVDTGGAAVAAVADECPAIVLLDIGLPDVGGLEVCQSIREWSPVPIILVTAADKPQTKVTGLEIGADDYLTKPFHMGELVARMHAVLRRAAGSSAAQGAVLEGGGIRVDVPARQAWRGDQEVRLTRTEFDLLAYLMRHADCVVAFRQLLDGVWGEGYDDVRNVHVYVCSLRRKIAGGPLGPRLIESVAGVGYRFRSGADQSPTVKS